MFVAAVRRIVALLLPPDIREFVIGDLQEEHERPSRPCPSRGGDERSNTLTPIPPRRAPWTIDGQTVVKGNQR